MSVPALAGDFNYGRQISNTCRICSIHERTQKMVVRPDFYYVDFVRAAADSWARIGRGRSVYLYSVLKSSVSRRQTRRFFKKRRVSFAGQDCYDLKSALAISYFFIKSWSVGRVTPNSFADCEIFPELRSNASQTMRYSN